MPPELSIALVAGEVSGDLLGAQLIKELKQNFPSARISGVGGKAMLEAGQEQWFSNEPMNVMGLTEVLGSLKSLIQLRKDIYQKILHERVNLFIGIDAPDFNFPLERKLKQQGLTAFHYVSPSIWAWRSSRINKIAASCDHIFCLFPFEPPLYQPVSLPATFVGHPMAQSIPQKLDNYRDRKNLALDDQTKMLALLPGSRQSEIKMNLPIMLSSMLCYYKRYAQLPAMVIPIAQSSLKTTIDRIVHMQPDLIKNQVQLVDGQAREVLNASDGTLIASGTATLEAMLLKKPMLVIYKVNPLTAAIVKRLLQKPWVSLPNVLANAAIVPELLQSDATPNNIATGLEQLLNDEDFRHQQLEQFTALHQQLLAEPNQISKVIQSTRC